MRRRGYTLMEVMIAMAILALALSVLLGTQANSAMMTERANSMALAALLARSKMIDIEGELMADGFSETSETIDGDFSDEGFDEMEFSALVEVIEITPDAQESFAASVNAQLFGSGEAGGALSGSSSVSQWMPMILAEVPNFINEVARRARKVTLTITWPDGRHEMTLTVQQYVVNLRPGGSEVETETLGGPAIAPGVIP
jgi:general secretion pathway protein I